MPCLSCCLELLSLLTNLNKPNPNNNGLHGTATKGDISAKAIQLQAAAHVTTPPFQQLPGIYCFKSTHLLLLAHTHAGVGGGSFLGTLLYLLNFENMNKLPDQNTDG